MLRFFIGNKPRVKDNGESPALNLFQGNTQIQKTKATPKGGFLIAIN